MLLPILKYPDPRLRTPCSDVTEFNEDLKALISSMFETMYAAPGIGLAAIQIGVFKNLIVLDIGRQEGENLIKEPKVIINPKIIKQEGNIEWEEGCLSCPDLSVKTNRFQKIELSYQDEDGIAHQLTAEDLLAVCIQHEMDHLQGILIFDKLSRLKQDFYKKKLQKGNIEESKNSKQIVR